MAKTIVPKSNISRRNFLGTVVTSAVAGAMHQSITYGKKSKQRSEKIPVVLHATDLFRPHGDPDDHWDLACVYALAYQGDIDLKGILVDNRSNQNYDPDIEAVAQMNFITGLSVPLAVGSPLPMKSRSDTQPYAQPSDHNAVNLVLDVLRESTSPVIINTNGSCRDIVIAGKKEPQLFAQKCSAIYVNAGAGSPDRDVVVNANPDVPGLRLETNVQRDIMAYAGVFDLPCPVYWMPCFEQMDRNRCRVIRKFGTWYSFQQGQILPHLSNRVQNCFFYMFEKVKNQSWLRCLNKQPNQALLAKQSSRGRNMFCTSGFFHAAGKAVTRDGRIVKLGQQDANAVFSFDPIKISCDDNAITQWAADINAENRFMFSILDIANYQSAITKALKSLLTSLP